MIHSARTNQKGPMKLLKILLLIIALGTLSAALYFRPLFEEFPQPTGSYSVGIRRFSVATGSPRFMVDMYYPSKHHKASTRYPYQPKKLAALKNIYAQITKVPAFVWSYLLSSTKSFAAQDAPYDKNGPFPLIIFLPGIAGDNLYNVYLEELASHGYVIAAIEPPGTIEGEVRELEPPEE